MPDYTYYSGKSIGSIDEGFPLLRLISEKKWKELEEELSLEKCIDSYVFDAKCKCCSKRHSLLHFACRFQPPLYIIKMLDNFCPDAVYHPDCKDQFPLHIAVENRASADVQSYLIERYNFAAKVPDINGKTPLHLLFRDYNVRRNSDPKNHMKETIENMKLLNNAAPMSVFSQDSSGKTALECAVSEHAEQKIQRKLQRVAREKINAQYASTRRRSWSDGVSVFSHDNVAKLDSAWLCQSKMTKNISEGKLSVNK